VRAALEERVRFETLLADLATTLGKGPDDAVPTPIERGLQQVVEFLGIDQSTLLELSRDRTHLHIVQSYTTPAVAADVSQALDHFPWSTETLRQGRIVCFARPDELPPEAWAERESCRRAGCRSGLTIPLSIDGEVRFAMTFRAFRAECAWPAELIPRLGLVGQLLANAISQKRSAEATNRLQQELVHVTRVAMLGELAATLVHEISRPLAAILSNAQAAHRLLAMASPQLEEVQAGLDDVIADTRRAADLLQRLRALAKKADVQRTTFDLNEVIREVVHLVGAEAGARQVCTRLQLQDDLPKVYGDRIQLQQVVLNFVLNALDAVVDVTHRPREIVVCTSAGPPNGITVAVEDSGIGLKDEILQRMFEPFFSTKGEGMGMGLAISRAIVMAHHGRIWATPHPDYGTTVAFSVPIDREEVR
jgi:signal transduction histidine kinase